MKSSYIDIHPLFKFAITALVALISLIVFMVLAAVVAIPIFGLDAFSGIISSTLVFDESNIALLKFFQLVQSIGLFIIPALILSFLFGESTGKYLQINKTPVLLSAVIATVIIFSVSPLINILGQWNASMTFPDWMAGIETWMKQSEQSTAKLTELFVKADSIGGLLFNIFLIALVPAIGEELLFRGILQRIFTDWTKNKHLAIWITAILFSALHFQFYGFLPRAILGAMFGYLLIWSGNLWLPIIAHFINNATAVVAYYLYNNGKINMDPDSIGVNSEYGIAAIISVIVVVGLFRIYYRIEKAKQSKAEFRL